MLIIDYLHKVVFFGPQMGPQADPKMGPQMDPKRDRKQIPKMVFETRNGND